MDERTRSTSEAQPIGVTDVRDPLQEQLRGWVRAAIETLLREELDAVLQATRYARKAEGTRQRYRHASRDRAVATSVGSTPVTVPRARLFDEGGTPSVEWQSTVLPRYQRRTRAIDQSLVGAYSAGANTRRVRGALAPLLGQAPISKST
jgi:transposase-like protein